MTPPSSFRLAPPKMQQILKAGEEQLSPEEFEEMEALIFDLETYGLTPWINTQLGKLMAKIEWELELEPSPEWHEALQQCDYAFLGNELKAMAYEVGASPAGHKKQLCARLFRRKVPEVLAVMEPYLKEMTPEQIKAEIERHAKVERLPEVHTAFRAGELKPTTGIMATEGYGLYITPDRETARAFAERFKVKEIQEIRYIEPRNPLILKPLDELPSISWESRKKADKWLFSPIKSDDSPWAKLHKQAAKDVKLIKGAPPTTEFNKQLDNLIRQAGYDAVVVPERGLARPGIRFTVLLDKNLYEQRLPQTEPLWASKLRDVKDRLEDIHRKDPEEFYQRKDIIRQAIREREKGQQKTMPDFSLQELQEILKFTERLYR